MPEIERVKIKKSEIEQLKVPAGNRTVVVKTLAKTHEDTTPSGILKVGDTDWRESVSAQRWGEVIVAPTRLVFKRGSDGIPWRTNIQILPGHIVWYDYLESLNTIVYTDENNDEYRLIKYESLYVSTFPVNGDNLNYQRTHDGLNYVVPLNGYVLFEREEIKPESKFSINNKVKYSTTKGVVRYAAEKNAEYDIETDSDYVDLQVDDVVKFNRIPCVFLEEAEFAKFDGGRMYRRAQARNIDLVWRGDELILPKGRILIKRIPDEMVRPSGVILLREKVKNHRGTVVLSSIEGVEVGQTVIYPIKGGVPMDYKGEDGHRILRDVQVLYIE